LQHEHWKQYGSLEGFLAFLVVKGSPRTCHLLRLHKNAKPETDVNLLVLRANDGETGRPNAVSPWSTGAEVGGAEHDRGAGLRVVSRVARLILTRMSFSRKLASTSPTMSESNGPQLPEWGPGKTARGRARLPSSRRRERPQFSCNLCRQRK
jgi:hypothetical protein